MKTITHISFTFLLLIAILMPVLPERAVAVTAGDWQPGRIIDDGVFTDANGMTVAEIQNFLNAKVPTCDTNGTQPATEYGRSDLTHAQYAATRGWAAPPYVCLKDYHEVPKTNPGPGIPANNFSGSIPAGAVSAAQMIYNAAQQYQINPKVLLVTIQKESMGPLTVDTWPLEKQYTYAMGAYCPDSGPGGSANCDPNYAGFSIQIAQSAALMRWYLDSMTQSWWQYKKPYQNNSILWNVAPTGCGAGNVYIQNKATAALYTYTPYQPNAAALANMYGTGDSCSAYGNRNFWRIYNDWFGSPNGQDYSWSLVQQQAFTDSSKSTGVGLGDLRPGQRRYLSLTVQNTGVATWTNSGINPVRLGTSRPLGRTSPFYDPTWLGYGRPAALKEATVAPGQFGTFEFWITVPEINQSVDFQEYFTPLAEGRQWMDDIGLYYSLYVIPYNYSWTTANQSVFTDETKTKTTTLYGTEPGQRKYISLTITNSGDNVWSSSGPNPLNLGTSNPRERLTAFYDETWLSRTRPARMKEATVSPGETATFEFWMKAPLHYYGATYEHFTPVLEGRNWLKDTGMNYAGSVLLPLYSWVPLSQYAFTDSSKITPSLLANLSPGEMVYVGMIVKNTSNVAWHNSGSTPATLGTFRPNDRLSIFCSNDWLGCNRPARMKESTVLPGETATFEFWMKAPSSTGTYREYFNVVIENKVWLPDPGLYYTLIVK